MAYEFDTGLLASPIRPPPQPPAAVTLPVACELLTVLPALPTRPPTSQLVATTLPVAHEASMATRDCPTRPPTDLQPVTAPVASTLAIRSVVLSKLLA